MAPLEPRASSASSGASGVAGDDSDRRRRPLPRRPEFGRERWRCYGALEEKTRRATCSWGFTEHGDVLRRGLRWPWPRRRGTTAAVSFRLRWTAVLEEENDSGERGVR